MTTKEAKITVLAHAAENCMNCRSTHRGRLTMPLRVGGPDLKNIFVRIAPSACAIASPSGFLC